jgi:small redox-active disulfide protein 2
MMRIQIVGVGCWACHQMEADVKAVVSEHGLEATIERVDDPLEIVRAGIISVPRLLVDGRMPPFRYRGRRSLESILLSGIQAHE